MSEIFSVALTILLAFMSADYALARARVTDPLKVVIAIVFAVLLVIVAGTLTLVDVIDLS